MGKTDSSLTEIGVSHAHRLAKRLRRLIEVPAAHPPIPVLSSPARRARETARLATEWTGSTILLDEDLWEIDFGKWEGMNFQEIASADPELVDEWAKGRMDFCFPGGERIEAFRERIHRAGRRMRGYREETVVVVTHGGVIRFLLCHFLALPPQSYLLFEVSPGSITRLRFYDGGAVLAGLNDFDY